MAKKKKSKTKKRVDVDFKDSGLDRIELVVAPLSVLHDARRWLEETPHRAGCQCHRCHWAHGIISGRVKEPLTYEEWRRR